MARNSNGSAGWIAGITIGVLGWFIHKIVSRFMPLSASEPGLKNLKGIAKGVPGSDIVEENIALRYELMCIKEPLKYQGHPLIKTVIEDYRKLLRGEIPDPEGRHIPSERLDGTMNRDYEKYLKAQQKVLGKASWVDQEIKRIGKEGRALRASCDLALLVMRFGLPSSIVPCLLTEPRINTYTGEQWNGLFQAVKRYLADEDRLTIHAIVSFLLDIPEYEYASDLESLEVYKTYLDNGVLRGVIVRIIRGEISDIQAQRAWEIAQASKIDFEDAITTVMKEDQVQDRVEGLRDSYRAQLRKR